MTRQPPFKERQFLSPPQNIFDKNINIYEIVNSPVVFTFCFSGSVGQYVLLVGMHIPNQKQTNGFSCPESLKTVVQCSSAFLR